jgi:hypothetical protein
MLTIISASGSLICALPFAIIPESPNYWAFVFPAMVRAIADVDIAFNVGNIFITTQTPSKQEGQAGALINSTLPLSMSILLDAADIALV